MKSNQQSNGAPFSREDQACEYFRQGYNCCQSVLLAFKDVMNLDEESILKIGTGLGGGMARTRELCGTVSAMAIVAGFLSPATEPSNQEQRRKGYSLVQQFAGRFQQKNGSIVCRDLLGKPRGWELPEPSIRTQQFYAKRPCEMFVRQASGILVEYLKTAKD